MDISVIIPTHNRLPVLVRAIESVLRQDYPPAEVIVVDDGSTDQTAQVIPTRFPEVIYLRQEHRGVSAARNLGIRQATAPWLAFLDSDDVWLPEKLAEQVKALRAQPRFRVCHTDEIWIRRGVRVNPKKRHAKYGGWIFERCLPLCVISPSSVMMHRSVLQKAGYFDESLPVCEDYDLWLRVCLHFPVLLVPRALIIKYGGHEDQLSRRYWGMDRFRIRALEKILANPALSVAQKRAVLSTLMEKINIYLTGARKREKWQEVEIYTRKLNLYTRLYEKLASYSPGNEEIGPDTDYQNRQSSSC